MMTWGQVKMAALSVSYQLENWYLLSSFKMPTYLANGTWDVTYNYVGMCRTPATAASCNLENLAEILREFVGGDLQKIVCAGARAHAFMDFSHIWSHAIYSNK